MPQKHAVERPLALVGIRTIFFAHLPATIHSTDAGEISARMSVKLGSVRADTRCAICWGTLKKVKVVSPCLHRFCQGCIEEHLRKL